LIFYLKRGRGVKKSSGQQSRNVKGRGAIRPRGCLGQDGDAAECQHCLRSHVPAVDHLLPLPLTSLPLPACDLEAPASPPLHHCPCALRDASTILFGMSRQGPRFCARVAPHHGTESAHSANIIFQSVSSPLLPSHNIPLLTANALVNTSSILGRREEDLQSIKSRRRRRKEKEEGEKEGEKERNNERSHAMPCPRP